MSRTQTGITPLPSKNLLILSFEVRDIPMSAMSVGHIAANVPGLASEIRKSYPGSDLRYALGFSRQLWNFIWQGSMPPGFIDLKIQDEIEKDIHEDENADDSGPELLFGFFASQTGVLHEAARQSQTHLKNIADVHETITGTPVENPATTEDGKTRQEPIAETLIGGKYPEYAQSSFLFVLGMTHESENSNDRSAADKEIPGKSLAKDFNGLTEAADKEIPGKSLAKDFSGLTENEPGLIHHLWKTEKESGHYLLAFCDHTRPFQNILDRLTGPRPASIPRQAPSNGVRITPSLFFLPSLEILAGLRMGALRMGPLSPTARWK